MEINIYKKYNNNILHLFIASSSIYLAQAAWCMEQGNTYSRMTMIAEEITARKIRQRYLKS